MTFTPSLFKVCIECTFMEHDHIKAIYLFRTTPLDFDITQKVLELYPELSKYQIKNISIKRIDNKAKETVFDTFFFNISVLNPYN